MKKIEYLQPDSVKSASSILNKNNASAIAFAGGTDVLGMIKDDLFEQNKLVNLKKIAGLNYIREAENGGLRIGALTKLSEIVASEIVRTKFTVLAEAAAEVATPQLRNVGTIGGNICQRPRCFYFRSEFDCLRKGGDICYAYTGQNKYHCIVGGGPCYIVHASDTAVALLALDAKFKIFDGKKEKPVDAKDFFVLPDVDETVENILKSGEILTEIILPPQPKGTKSKYIKVKERGSWDFAVVSIAGVFNMDGIQIRRGKITFGGVAPAPWEEKQISDTLNGFSVTESAINTLSGKAFPNAEALDYNEYKITMARNLIKKLLLEI